MHIELSTSGRGVLVRVRGDLDLLTAEQFRREVDAVLDRTRARDLYLNLAGVTFIDSSGLGAILGRYKRVRNAGGRMALISPAPVIRPVLELAGLHKLMEIHESETAVAG